MRNYYKLTNFFMCLLLGSVLFFFSACGQENQYGHFERVGDLNIPRARHTATLLRDGRVLIAGGDSLCIHRNGIGEGVGCGGPLKSLEIYDPKTKQFTLAGELQERHYNTEAPLLPDGRVVFVGAPGDYIELYDPVTKKTTLAAKLIYPRQENAVTVLKNGNILITGGRYDDSRRRTNWQGLSEEAVAQKLREYARVDFTAEIYNPNTGQLNRISDMSLRHEGHSAELLPNGKVFLLGGPAPRGPKPSEFYDPRMNAFTLSKMKFMCGVRGPTVVMGDGKIILFCAKGALGVLKSPPISAKIIDPVQETYTDSKSLLDTRSLYQATLLPSDQILIASGQTDVTSNARFDLYNQATDTVTPLGDLPENHRFGYSVTRLQDGSVLIVGGAKTLSKYKQRADLFIEKK
jgi:hypothetical protein